MQHEDLEKAAGLEMVTGEGAWKAAARWCEDILRKSVNDECSCGGAEPGKACPACEVLHGYCQRKAILQGRCVETLVRQKGEEGGRPGETLEIETWRDGPSAAHLRHLAELFDEKEMSENPNEMNSVAYMQGKHAAWAEAAVLLREAIGDE